MQASVRLWRQLLDLPEAGGDHLQQCRCDGHGHLGTEQHLQDVRCTSGGFHCVEEDTRCDCA